MRSWARNLCRCLTGNSFELPPQQEAYIHRERATPLSLANNCELNADASNNIKTEEERSCLDVAKEADEKPREVKEGATPLSLADNCELNADASNYIKTEEERSCLDVAEEADEKPREVKGNTDLRENTNMAIPLCLPNNCHWNAASGEYNKTGERRSSLYVVDEALKKLRELRGPVCVVSIAGPCRKGKSYVLGKAFDQPALFSLGHHFDPETMGIWMWIVPGKFRVSSGQECNIVLLDTEGIDAVTAEGLDDSQIFTLSVLLASVVIYNSAGVPTRRDLDGLDFIVKLSQRINFRSSNEGQSTVARQEDTDFFHKTFPFFTWLLRDVALDLPPDCKDVKDYFLTRVFKADHERHSVGEQAQSVAESILRFFPGFQAFQLPSPTLDKEVLKNIHRNESQLSPKFLKGIKEFKQLLWSVLTPKRSFNDGEVVTGEGLAALVELYVDAINTPGTVPNVQTAWETFVATKCSKACKEALNIYDAMMNAELQGKLPCDGDHIRRNHELALEKGVTHLETETSGISAITTEKYLKELTASCDKNLGSWRVRNETLTRKACNDLLKSLKEEHLDPVLNRLHGEGRASVSFDEIIQGYKRIEQDYKDRAKGAKDVCAAEFYESYLNQMQQDLGVFRKLKDFDDNLTRETEARAYEEKEKMRVEEERARLQQESNERLMEILKMKGKFEEDSKRLREQAEAKAKGQQEQLENMVKATMEENQTLKKSLEEIQEKRIGEMEKKVTSLELQLQEARNKNQGTGLENFVTAVKDTYQFVRDPLKTAYDYLWPSKSQ